MQYQRVVRLWRWTGLPPRCRDWFPGSRAQLRDDPFQGRPELRDLGRFCHVQRFHQAASRIKQVHVYRTNRPFGSISFLENAL